MRTDRRSSGRVSALVAIAALTLLIAGCSYLVWGPQGTAVIQTANEFSLSAADGRSDGLMCAGVKLDLREPGDWEDVAGEEPEEFKGEYWPRQKPLNPDWSINLYVPFERQVVGTEIPGYLFFRETDEGLCVVDVVWVQVESAS